VENRSRRMKRHIPAVSSAEESEVTLDAFQIGLIELLPRRRDPWRPDTRRDSWMFTTMTNAWIDEARSRGRRGRPALVADLEGGAAA
jgi:DNA-directed RNA polymerase specialized sigma24 family protein